MSRQPGMQPQRAEGEEAHVVVGEHRHGERHDAAAELARPARDGAQLVRRPRSGSLGVDAEHVPVERPVAPRRSSAASSSTSSSLKRSRHPSVMTSSDVPVVTGRRPRTARRTSSSRAHAARHRRRRRRRRAWTSASSRSPSPPASIDSSSSSAHGVDLARRGLVADEVLAHHVAAQRAVTDEEPGVDADVAVEARRGTRRSVSHVHGTPCFERRQRHALDLRHHPAGVVGVASLSGASVKPQLPPMTRRDTVPARRRGQRVPEELGVVVGVRVDEPGRDDEAGRRRASWRAGSSSVADGDDAAVARRRRRPAAPGAPVPSTTVATGDRQIEHDVHARRRAARCTSTRRRARRCLKTISSASSSGIVPKQLVDRGCWVFGPDAAGVRVVALPHDAVDADARGGLRGRTAPR